MALGQVLLDTMELINQELQLQSGEADVTRALVALNRSQDYMESLAAAAGKSLQSTTTVTTVANTETTAKPAGLLRVDRLQLLDSNSRPVRDVIPINRTGGHVEGSGNWAATSSSSTTGKPAYYSEDDSYFYWTPLPDGVSTIRVYGLIAASDISAAGTFAYKDIAILPVASFACRLMRLGVDDSIGDVASVAQETFSSVLTNFSSSRRDGAKGLEYSERHSA